MRGVVFHRGRVSAAFTGSGIVDSRSACLRARAERHVAQRRLAVDLPAAGRYHLLVRGHATDETVRRLWPNDVEVGPIVFLATRGLGDLAFAG